MYTRLLLRDDSDWVFRVNDSQMKLLLCSQEAWKRAAFFYRKKTEILGRTDRKETKVQSYQAHMQVNRGRAAVKRRPHVKTGPHDPPPA